MSVGNALIVYPFCQADPVANMADDACLLHSATAGKGARLRIYGWTGPGGTFGYSQRWAEVREQATPGPWIRRETGGGMVTHGADLCYGLVITPSHPAYAWTASVFYQALHEAVAESLHALGQAAVLAPCLGGCAPKGLAAACFQRAEPFDVIEPQTGRKLAGAALRRHRVGLLAQGSVEIPSTGGASELEQALGLALARRFELQAVAAVEESPASSDERAAWRAHFGSEAWNRRR